MGDLKSDIVIHAQLIKDTTNQYLIRISDVEHIKSPYSPHCSIKVYLIIRHYHNTE